MSNQIGDGPIQPELKEGMLVVAETLDEFFNPNKKPGEKRKVGFVLMVFNFGVGEKKRKDDRCNYISTANREDVITLLKEQLSYFEGMPSNQKGTG